MKTENQKGIAILRPDELWLAPEISAEELIRRDALESDEDLIRMADEALGIDDLTWIPYQPNSVRFEDAWLKAMRLAHGPVQTDLNKWCANIQKEGSV